MNLNPPKETRFRPIQPASSEVGSGYDAVASPFKCAIPKKRAVFRACYDCRKAKTKCDGIRPKCGPCLTKDRVCGYDTVETASSLPQASVPPAPASRLEVLELLIDLLQKSSSDQAARLLQRIRASDNPVAMLDALGESPTFPPIAEGPSAKDHLEHWLRSQDPSDYSSIPGCSTTSGSVLSDSDGASSFNMTSVSSQSKTPYGPRGKDALVVGEADEDAMDMQCPPIAAKICFNSIQHDIPDASVTQEALKVFFICSGRLLHVFSKEQGAQLYRAVYNNRTTSAKISPLDLGCLMSIASVGAQYMCGTFGREIEETFYEIGKHHLDAIIQHRPLDAIKVCSLLAVYNVMGKATVSLAYVEIGLGLCRRFGLNKSTSTHSAFSEESWIDYRKTWRTMMFLSSWLSTTLGYISGNDTHDDRVSLSDLQVDLPRDTSDVVQTEIAKICVLKASILRAHLAVDDITALALGLIVQDLQDWYTHLPPEMRLDCTGRDDLDLETKRSISHIHLHYLGAIMLFYSRIASQFMQPLKDWASISMELRLMLEKLAGEAVVAARTSSRVLWLLFEEHSIFKRCWLVIFQAYTSCLVLLHAAAQKQLHGFSVEELMEDIGYIKDSLAILYFCGELDPVAAAFHKQLTAVFEDILARGSPRVGSVELMMDIQNGNADMVWNRETHGEAYLLTMPAHADDSHFSLSMSLLSMLCRPFGHPSSVIIGPSQVSSSMEEVVPRTRTWSKWGLDQGKSFQWDLDMLLWHDGEAEEGPDDTATRNFLQSNSCGHFLGSREPSGWMSSPPTRETVR